MTAIKDKKVDYMDNQLNYHVKEEPGLGILKLFVDGVLYLRTTNRNELYNKLKRVYDARKKHF